VSGLPTSPNALNEVERPLKQRTVEALKQRVLSAFTHGTAEELAVTLHLIFELSFPTPKNNETGSTLSESAGLVPKHVSSQD